MRQHGHGSSQNSRAPAGQPHGFNFTARMHALCTDVVCRIPELHHVDMSRVAVSFSQARKRVRHGLYAALTPMRFAGGALSESRQGRRYTVQRLVDSGGREMLYLLSFYLPRFMDTTYQEKLVTVFHELWHISPDFNGDLRRHPGRCYAHTHSQEKYDARMWQLACRWLALDPPEPLHQFLRCDFEQLCHRHGRVYGQRITKPKLIPCRDP